MLNDYLMSGWLYCPVCGSGATLDYVVVGKMSGRIRQAAARPDVPGGHGFVHRLVPSAAGDDDPLSVIVSCNCIDAQRVVHSVSGPARRQRRLVGVRRETADHVFGWVVGLDPPSLLPPLPNVLVDGRSCPVEPGPLLPDVSEFFVGLAAREFVVVLDGPFSCMDVQDGDDSRALLTYRSTAPTATEPARWWLEDNDLVRLARSYVREQTPSPVPLLMHLLQERGFAADEAAVFALLSAEPQLRSQIQHLARPSQPMAWMPLDRLHQMYGSVMQAPGTESDVTQSRQEFLAWLGDDRHEAATAVNGQRLARAAGGGAADDRLVVGLVGHPSGVGQNADYSVRLLTDHGRAPLIAAASDPDHPQADRPAAASGRELALLHWPVDRLGALLRANSWLMQHPRLLAMCVWETSVLPAALRAPLDLLDEIWCPTRFVADAFSACTDRPVRVVPHVVQVDDVERLQREDYGIRLRDFVVHFSFDAHSTAARKNPVAVLRAFKDAFSDGDAVLLLKVRNLPSLAAAAAAGDPHARSFLAEAAREPRLRLIADEVDKPRALGLVALSNCYLSLHRSEGFGYGLAEAMALGVPTVATSYSGNMDYMTSDNSWLVPFEPRRVLPREYFFWEPDMTWAEPDVSAAASLLQQIRDDAPAAAERSRRAAAMNRYSFPEVQDQYRQAIAAAVVA